MLKVERHGLDKISSDLNGVIHGCVIGRDPLREVVDVPGDVVLEGGIGARKRSQLKLWTFCVIH